VGAGLFELSILLKSVGVAASTFWATLHPYSRMDASALRLSRHCCIRKVYWGRVSIFNAVFPNCR